MSLRTQTVSYAGSCAFCGQGLLGFVLSGDGEMMLFCDECDTTWASPADVDTGEPLLNSHSEIRWATRQEIEARGWGTHIVGEYSYHVNKFGVRISDEKAEAEERKRLKRQQSRER